MITPHTSTKQSLLIFTASQRGAITDESPLILTQAELVQVNSTTLAC